MGDLVKAILEILTLAPQFFNPHAYPARPAPAAIVAPAAPEASEPAEVAGGWEFPKYQEPQE